MGTNAALKNAREYLAGHFAAEDSTGLQEYLGYLDRIVAAGFTPPVDSWDYLQLCSKVGEPLPPTRLSIHPCEAINKAIAWLERESVKAQLTAEHTADENHAEPMWEGKPVRNFFADNDMNSTPVTAKWAEVRFALTGPAISKAYEAGKLTSRMPTTRKGPPWAYLFDEICSLVR